MARGFHGGENKIVVLWVKTPCSLAYRYQRFEETYSFYRQDGILFYGEDGGYVFLACQPTRRHKPEDCIMRLCRSEYLIFYKCIFNKAILCKILILLKFNFILRTK